MSKQSSSTSKVILPVPEWNTSAVRYMQPKISDRGSKSINIISTQTNRALHLSTPLMKTWGIADFVDEKGESDGKFSLSLNFPNEDYATPATTEFLTKLKAFENQILDDAVKNSEAWFGEEMSREVAKHTFFPFLKYSKDKVTKKIDLSKAPSIRAKVPNYGGRWGVEIYDTKGKMLFPCDNENMTPMDFVEKGSNVACVLQCGGLWFGGKGWGITWKLIQAVVKPSERQSVFGKCHIQLSTDEIDALESQPTTTDAVVDDDEVEEPLAETKQVSTEVEDSDEEAEPEPVQVEAPKKKVVKKAAEPVQEPVQAEAEPAQAEAPKKKVVKKAVKA
uniref:Uncharacterized protein n=1 Tax=viral metagenome TaxID=1070528 RepID=A0A6C0D4M7_9ZZZZ